MTDRSPVLPWRDSGVWLKGDTHTHHRLIGGREMIDGAAPYCDFIALTSHAHNPDAVAAHPDIIAYGADAHPDLLIVNGVEWNTPTYELAAVLVPGDAEAMPVIEELMRRFDRQVVKMDRSEQAFLEALRYLEESAVDGVAPGVILQHLHTDHDFASVRSDAALESDAIVGVSAASRRHVMDDGTYVSPWVSAVGGVIDVIYAKSRRLFMAAESDFHHHHRIDANMGREWPGEFLQTCIYCPERSERGLFEGMRAGCSYFVIGGIVDEVEWYASSGDRTALAGETLSVSGAVTAVVSFTENEPVDCLELIGNPGGATRILASASGGKLERKDDCAVWSVRLPSEGPYFVRLRGIAERAVADTRSPQFYTNLIWIEA